MSIFGKIALILTFVCVLAAAVLGWMVQNKVTEQTETINTQKANLANAEKQAQENKNLAEEKTKQAEREAQEAANAKQLAAKAQQEFEAAQKKVTDLNGQLSEKDKQISAKQEEFEQFKASWGDLTPEKIKEQQTQFDREFQILSDEKVIIADGLEKARNELEVIKDREERRKKGILPMGLRGTITAVNPEWNFVVLNIGEADQVVEGAQMLVYRGNTMLGRVKIRNVEQRSCVADIISLTDAGRGQDRKNGLDIRPGDSVIF